MRRGLRILKLVLLIFVSVHIFALLATFVGWFFRPVLVERMVTYPFYRPATSVKWYTPLERVQGGPVHALEEAPKRTAALDHLENYAKQRNSVALLVVQEGRIVKETYFKGHDVEKVSNSFSLAKTLLALLIGAAIEEGAIGSIAEPVERYLPSWRGRPEGKITIEQLLRMQSGLRYDNNLANPFSDMVQVHMSTDLLPTVLGMELETKPGTVFRYNNLNSQLLGVVLERATGRRWADYLSEKLWRPLGNRDASVWLDKENGTAKTYCCTFATARDWARVGLLLLHGGRAPRGEQLVPVQFMERMFTADPRWPAYGFQIWLSPDYFWLDGLGRQRVIVIPKSSTVIVRLGERALDWDDQAFISPLL